MSAADDLGPLIGPIAAPDLHVMSYNIRRTIRGTRQGSADHWPHRRPLMEQLLRSEAPTILGVQEAMARQADAVGDMLGEHYHRIGRGRRSDGKGEGCPVFYDSRRVRLVRWSQLALSPTPDVAGSRGWGNMVPRIAVHAQFDCLATGARFALLNAHFDHLSRRSRVQSAAMVAGLARDPSHPAIVMGDFNAEPESPSYHVLGSSGLRDTWLVAEQRRGDGLGTYSGYKPPVEGGRRIDWMLVTPGIEVRVAGVNARRFDGRAPSDHEPIQSVLRLS